MRTTKSCFFLRRSLSSWSRLSKNAMSVAPTPVACIAASTRLALALSNGLRRSSVFATGSSIASGGTSVSVGWRAAEIWMFGQSSSRANSSQSSMARSGSSSRIRRGVSSCNAAVRTLIFMNFGSKARAVMGSPCCSGVCSKRTARRGVDAGVHAIARAHGRRGAEPRCGRANRANRPATSSSDRCARRCAPPLPMPPRRPAGPRSPGARRAGARRGRTASARMTAASRRPRATVRPRGGPG